MALKQLPSEKKLSKRALQENRFEELWLSNPEQFNPENSAEGKTRLERTLKILPPLQDKICVDLGSGYGVFAKEIAKNKGHVTAIDISKEALKKIEGCDFIQPLQQYVPNTSLTENSYDLVLALDLVASLPESDHRLFFSELARLAKPTADIIVSTQIDIDSEDALARFFTLAETELAITSYQVSFHRLYLKIHRFLSKGGRFLSFLTNFFEKNVAILHFLEKITCFLYDEEGITHIVIKAKRKPLF